MNVMSPTLLESLPFVDAVATRSKMDLAEVEATLTKHGVVAAPSPPPARQLRVQRIAFAGVKVLHGVTSDFDFSWDVDQDGVFGIVTADNLVGKTTVIQVVLWALRGSTKNLSDTVASWLRSVDVTFLADKRAVRVAFAIEDAKPSGTASVGAGTDQKVHRFVDEPQFKRVMQEIMLEALALEPIPATRKLADGRMVAWDDGWTAYTGAFLADADSDAIIGEHIGNDLTQRLLQVFVGLPWARTLFQARARLNVLESEAQQRKRKLAGLGGKSIEEVELELAGIKTQITDEGNRNETAQRLLRAQAEYDAISVEVRAARERANVAEEDSKEAQLARIRTERVLLSLQEENAAAAFFGRLSPKCCPRCSGTISKSRLEQERKDRTCSVCTEVAPEPDAEAIAAELRLATQRVTDAKALEVDARKFATKAGSGYDGLRAQFLQAGKKLQGLSVMGSAADVRTLEHRRERLEGMLEVAKAVVSADMTDADELKILEAARDEASERISAAANIVLTRASDEVARIVKRLGMKDVESVTIKRNANVTVRKGGAESSWSGLSAGEQLRMRIATVIALVRSARAHQTGRHPGLLLIDSPKREEVAEANLADMLGELKLLAAETPGLQMFVALQGQKTVFGEMAPDRLKIADTGNYLW
ncbi:hypothetical protein ACN2CC_35430 (plasmid) [Mesorhizobium muleiense]|uniref:hypothetical protein n=1 Tax=Mesorhizobium muleiense TaxID=1004279 RepID=UPI003AFA3D3F